MGSEYHYKAFISYSHRDRELGEWLHKRLERYRFPKGLVGKETPLGPVPARLGRVFRDRDELPASDDLTQEVRKAIEQSEFMVVLCSPNAASSRWVNREIIDFKRVRGDKYVLPIIIDGEPFASGGDNPENECFPSALRFKIGPDGRLSTQPAEPIAADIRKSADGEQRAFQKIIAGLAGVGLDEIIERDFKRKQKIVMSITVLSLLAVIVMGALTNEAVTARQEAEKQRAVAVTAQRQAEFQRGEAEGLIEFMLTELRDKLRSVGRLDALGAVGERAVGYYDGQNLTNMPDASVGRSARAFHLFGEVQNTLGNREDALSMFERAARATGAALERDPENPERLFDHSQSVYWVGALAWDKNNIAMVDENWRAYFDYATKMVALEPDNIKWQRELGFANSNIGRLYHEGYNDPKQAIEYFQDALEKFELVWASDRKNNDYAFSVANIHAWLADANYRKANYQNALIERKRQKAIFDIIVAKEPNNRRILGFMAGSMIEIAQYNALLSDHYDQGNFDTAIQFAESNHAYDPDNEEWLAFLTSILLDYASMSMIYNRFDVAEATLDRATELLQGKNITLRGRDLTLATSLFRIKLELITEKENAFKDVNGMVSGLILKQENALATENDLIVLAHALYYQADYVPMSKKEQKGLYQQSLNILSNLEYLSPYSKILLSKICQKLKQKDRANLYHSKLIEEGISGKFLERINF